MVFLGCPQDYLPQGGGSPVLKQVASADRAIGICNTDFLLKLILDFSTTSYLLTLQILSLIFLANLPSYSIFRPSLTSYLTRINTLLLATLFPKRNAGLNNQFFLLNLGH